MLLPIAFFALSLTSCVTITFNPDGDIDEPVTPPGPEVPPTVAVASIEINQTALTLDEGESFTLTANILPANATNKEVLWRSENENVATVVNGTVTAILEGETAIYATSKENENIYAVCALVVNNPYVTKEINIDYYTHIDFGNYSTNFGTFEANSYEFGYYRAASSSYDVGTFYAYASLTSNDDGSLPGAIYNIDPISGIKSIDITYKSNSPLKLSVGVNRDYTAVHTLSSSMNMTTANVTFNKKANYFMLETTGSDMYINSIVIHYDESITTQSTKFYTNDERIEPTTFTGTLVDGVSTVEVPTSITKVGGTYTVNSYKEYTYYSYDYVASNYNSLDLDAIAMTDPVDIANYYIAFKEIPANFGAKTSVDQDCGSVSNVNNIFGDNARCVSQYSRTDGYAYGLPYNKHGSTGKPLYYEFDIDVDGNYSTSSRGTGRVVMWLDGFSCYEDNTPVPTLTYDHYATFQEYLNDGTWGTPFDTNNNPNIYRTNYLYGETTTLK